MKNKLEMIIIMLLKGSDLGIGETQRAEPERRQYERKNKNMWYLWHRAI
jgi:hypothetical protein